MVRENYLARLGTGNKLVGYEADILLKSEGSVFCTPRRLSFAEKREVSRIVDELLERGVIRPSSSPYASPIVLTKKKSGETRMCIDYRSLNKLVLRDNYPLPVIDDCLEHLEGSPGFTRWMTENSIKYTSFATPNGQFEFLRLPFGLKNGPAIFQRFVNEVFRDFLARNEVVIYMDDILVASRTLDEHLALLDRVLKRLAEYGLELKFQKCKLAYSRIEYLGYDISERGIRPSGSHIEAIRTYPRPRTVREVQAFLGLCSYFRKFVRNFSLIARPLYNLTKEGIDFLFDGECQSAFEDLKGHLTSAPILSIYSPVRETELHCDASAVGFGSILLQRQDDCEFHPVAYFSRRTSDAEAKYHSFELETLAIIYSLTLNKRTMNNRIARWALELENYNYTIIHRQGTRMSHVDALSRGFSDLSVISTIDCEDMDFQLCAMQNKDEKICDLRKKLESSELDDYDMANGIVYRKIGEDLKLYVPAAMETEFIRRTHE